MFLRDLWYFACPAAELKPGQMRRLEVLGEPVLLGRDGNGQVLALHDICPHRGVPLSAGRLYDAGETALGAAVAETQVECPYHGWRFGADGRCRAIPSLLPDQDVDVEKIRVRCYPVHEAQGLVWIYMPDWDALPPTENRPAPAVEPPELPAIGAQAPRFKEEMAFACHVDHAVIGLMDPAHGPFVHRAWWWRTPQSIHEKAKAFGPVERGFSMLKHPPSKNSLFYRVLGTDLTTEICFHLPGYRTELIQTKSHTVLGFTAVTPVNEANTHVTQLFYWTAGWLNLVRPLFRPFAHAFLKQDHDMVMLQREGLKYEPRLMLINDADVQAKWYYRLKKAWADARATGGAFENPVREATLRWRS